MPLKTGLQTGQYVTIQTQGDRKGLPAAAEGPGAQGSTTGPHGNRGQTRGAA